MADSVADVEPPLGSVVGHLVGQRLGCAGDGAILGDKAFDKRRHLKNMCWRKAQEAGRKVVRLPI
jgi:hypothetical protein